MSNRSLAFMFLSIVCSLMFIGCAHRAPVAVPTPPAATSGPAGMTAPAALADAARALAGTWDCRGSVFGPEGPSPSRVNLNVRRALDDAWLQTEFVVGSGRYPYKFTSHRTFEASSGTWVNLIVDNLGGHTVSRSPDGVTWNGESSSPMGEMRIRDTETILSPGRVNMLGQYSLDGGKSWSTGYELSCER